ncbi:MAG: hypothetical protein K0R44_1778 [Thermomicrobiales bacterium]|jgi:hypothetical protein|nr:hypothetical protein [Thermomicrobiales bacterium]
MDDRDRERRGSMVWPTQERNGWDQRADIPARRGTMVPTDYPQVARDGALSRARPEMDGPHARA